MPPFQPRKVAPHPVHQPPPPPPPAKPRREEGHSENELSDRRRELGSPLLQCCTCPCALLAGSALLLVLAAVVVVPLLISLKTPSSSSEIATSSSTTTMASTTTSTTASSTTSSTTLTTAVLCVPSCTSHEICVLSRCLGIGYLSFTMTWSRKGDGDIVVKTPNAKIIYYNNTGPSSLTDQGTLDIDDRNGTGPENVVWSNSGPVPPIGVYYVCFEPYFFNPTITSPDPISVTLNVRGSNNSTSTVVHNWTSTISNAYDCHASSPTFLLSYSYP